KRKEFINWFLAAKREQTQLKRLSIIVEMVANDTFLY
ncbi:MAG: Bacteriocin-protection, YdeI or OmpD-Associated, partial [Bacteroidota bacterium]